ncbi:phosphoribosyl-ATP pyrophosphatase [Methanolobus vulcani]|jgi:phosphoribosyl-ATP pyrophosphohydrolase|uniref:Phosphoribosyl-ATP pyrophosphatase n=1 Tax=Methanolobus vulcani TaxID=38026 RepID=A0A7Z7FDB2_9EURY|nr:phosphoribosyl-ATP diphosphatase [Methanolobus vulcani]MDK2827162.1 phosphoribosyl-ATP pyrophosphohydrolase [Methanolobus sp.]SDG10665.1 phosphoribosyl-ATP pyrophosphatase [Methanolobus vulcani]
MPETDLSILNELYDIITDRKENPSEDSYVCSLLNHRKGIDKILEKVGEESIETILAVKSENKEEMIYESSDLLFHLMVMFVAKGITLDEIATELKKRRK